MVKHDKKEVMNGPNDPTVLRRAPPGADLPKGSATLSSAILREINAKGKDARFVKTDRGKFGLAKK